MDIIINPNKKINNKTHNSYSLYMINKNPSNLNSIPRDRTFMARALWPSLFNCLIFKQSQHLYMNSKKHWRLTLKEVMCTFKIMSNSTYILIIITKFVTVAIFFRLAHLPQFFGIQFMNSWYVRINSFGAKYILSKFVHHPHTVFFFIKRHALNSVESFSYRFV